MDPELWILYRIMDKEIFLPDISVYFLQDILMVHLAAPGLCFVLFFCFFQHPGFKGIAQTFLLSFFAAVQLS